MFGNPAMTGLHQFTMWEHYFTGSIYLVLGCVVFSLCGMCIIFLARQSPKPRRKYAILIHVLITAMAVNGGDPAHASSSIVGRWLYGSVGCQLMGFWGFFGGMSHIWMLFAFAMERYMAVCHREFYQQMPSVYYSIIVGLMYTFGTFWATMPLLGWASYGLEVHGTSCTINYSVSDESYQSYVFFLAIFSFIFPMVSGWYAISKAWSGLSAIPDAEKEKDKDILSEEQLTALAGAFILISLISWSGFGYVAIYSALTHGGAQLSHLRGHVPPIMSKTGCALFPLLIFLLTARSLPKSDTKKP
uniref:Retinochrome n=1 Tax=Todarodes pacificus TaxID=6637 RepID=REIS_TODPA|nr:RecName: Full=Retinochrome; AltName: Full=Retinal photoisomerase [Todarodes pacificus]CAA40422.1 retinochrome [Todarodes pacificus]prf//1617116A retinal photoisomerase [Todarodes pacificus]